MAFGRVGDCSVTVTDGVCHLDVQRRRLGRVPRPLGSLQTRTDSAFLVQSIGHTIEVPSSLIRSNIHNQMPPFPRILAKYADYLFIFHARRALFSTPNLTRHRYNLYAAYATYITSVSSQRGSTVRELRAHSGDVRDICPLYSFDTTPSHRHAISAHH